MTITDLIVQLQDLKIAHGDLEIVISQTEGDDGYRYHRKFDVDYLGTEDLDESASGYVQSRTCWPTALPHVTRRFVVFQAN